MNSPEEQKAPLEGELKHAQEDCSSEKTAMSDATALREKQVAAYTAEKADSNANIAAIKAAVPALEKGMAGGFLKTYAAQLLKKLAFSNQSRYEDGRGTVLTSCGTT